MGATCYQHVADLKLHGGTIIKTQVKLIRAGQIITGGERTEEDTPGKKGNNKKPKVITQETNNKSQTMTLTELPAKSETSCLHIMTQTMSRAACQGHFYL